MSELYKVSAQEARLQLSDLINKAVYGRQPSLITRQSKPVAVLIAYDQWQAFQQWQQAAQAASSTSHLETSSDENSSESLPNNNQAEILASSKM